MIEKAQYRLFQYGTCEHCGRVTDRLRFDNKLCEDCNEELEDLTERIYQLLTNPLPDNSN